MHIFINKNQICQSFLFVSKFYRVRMSQPNIEHSKYLANSKQSGPLLGVPSWFPVLVHWFSLPGTTLDVGYTASQTFE